MEESKEYCLLFREANTRFPCSFQFLPTSANMKFECDSFHFYTYHMYVLHSEFRSLVYSDIVCLFTFQNMQILLFFFSQNCKIRSLRLLESVFSRVFNSRAEAFSCAQNIIE